MIFQKILLELKHGQNPKLFVNLNLKISTKLFFNLNTTCSIRLQILIFYLHKAVLCLTNTILYMFKF